MMESNSPIMIQKVFTKYLKLGKSTLYRMAGKRRISTVKIAIKERIPWKL